jgi:hypothetical protein
MVTGLAETQIEAEKGLSESSSTPWSAETRHTGAGMHVHVSRRRPAHVGPEARTCPPRRHGLVSQENSDLVHNIYRGPEWLTW